MDARTLLRAQREQRRINHPLAAYSSTGQLFCTACRLPLKSDSLWDLHIRSSQHHGAVSKQELAQQHDWDAVAAKRSNGDAGLKRKARDRDDEDEDDAEDQRAGKKARPATAIEPSKHDTGEESLLKDSFTTIAKITHDSTESQPKTEVQLPSHHRPQSSEETRKLPTNQPNGTHLNGDVVDEDEWAAFEREIAADDALAATSNVIIQAPAISAQELAAQAIKEQSEQKDSREAELEDAREDAQRQLEDEFEQMENYENRIRKLRNKREGVKSQSLADTDRTIVNQPSAEKEASDHDDDDDDDSDDSEEFLWKR